MYAGTICNTNACIINEKNRNWNLVNLAGASAADAFEFDVRAAVDEEAVLVPVSNTNIF